MHAVGDEGLAPEKLQSFIRPVNAITQPVGNKHGPVLVQSNDMRLRQIEIRVVVCYDGIVKDRAPQFLRALHAARDHRIWIVTTPGRILTR